MSEHDPDQASIPRVETTRTEAPDRRVFLAGSIGAVLATSRLPRLRRTPREVLRVGLIGCGGRGTDAAIRALRADPDARLVAMADAFADRVEASLGWLASSADVAERVDVPMERRFAGLEGFRGVIANCDVVLLASPPHFRARHLEAAVEAKRHLFVEKPVATDVPGLLRVEAACERARAEQLTLVGGLCYRYSRAKRETLERVHAGAVGEIVALQCTYNTSELWLRDCALPPSHLEYQVRNWLYFTWLSGDLIAEQHIHSLDKLAWAMGDWPVAATSSGGRVVRTDPAYGNVYDHFNTVYEWPGGVRGFSSCRQWNGAANDVSDWVYGTEGRAELQSHRIERRDADSWRWRSEEPDDMYQNEMDELMVSVREGTAINDGEVLCRSTLMALMGRMAAYTGERITLERARSSKEDLSPAAYEWKEIGVRPIARPGITKFL